MPDMAIRQPLTAERLRELADRGLSQTEIATETGYSRQRVNSACRQHGIEPVKKPWRPPAEHQERATAGRLAKRKLTGKSRAGMLRRQRAYMARRTAKLKADGICVKCAVAPVVRFRTKCAACALADTEREKQRQAMLPKPAAKPKPAPVPVAKPPKPKPKPVAPPKRRRETVPCALCPGAVDVRRAVVQPTGALWPRCVKCAQRVAEHVQGIRSARAARQDGEGEA